MSHSEETERTPEGSASPPEPWPAGPLALGGAAVVVLVALPFLELGVDTQVPRLLLFMGRFHPSLLHFPVAFLVLALFFEAVRLSPLSRVLSPVPEAVVDLVVQIAAVTGFGAAFAGWVLASEGGYDRALLDRHLVSGVATGIGAVACAVARSLAKARPEDGRLGRAASGLLVATCAVMGFAAHAGGSLTHGEDYLTEHAPAFVRRALGLHVPRDRSREPVTVLAERQAFDGVVLRILEDHCTSCHNPGKVKGGLRLDTHEGALAGGQSGPVLMSEDPAASELMRRIRRPLDDKKHMPPSGTEQLTADEIALLGWWIEAGLPNEETLRDLGAPPELRTAFARTLPERERRAVEELQTRLAAEYEATLASVRQAVPGVLRAITPGERDLEYTAAIAGTAFGDEELRELATVSGDLVWLDLSRTGVTDEGLSVVATMEKLERLDLRETGVGDAGVEALATLPKLRTLGLYDTAVADEGLRILQDMESLQRVYVGGASITPEVLNALGTARPDLEIVP